MCCDSHDDSGVGNDSKRATPDLRTTRLRNAPTQTTATASDVNIVASKRTRWVLVVTVSLLLVAASMVALDVRPTVRAATAQADFGDVESLIKASGTLEPAAYVDIGAQVSGQVKQLIKREGESVKQGEVVAIIDDTLAKANLLEQRSMYEQLIAERLAQQATLNRADRRSERYRGLLELDAIARDDVESAEALAQSSAALLRALDAQVRQAEALVESAEAKLNYTLIRSPIAGIVVKTYVREGQTLLASQNVPQVMKVADMGTMMVVAEVAEKDVLRLRIGQEAYFSIAGQPTRRWSGRLRQVNPLGQRTTEGVFYKALLEATNDGTLMSEMTAEVAFVMERVSEAVRVPLSALRDRQGNQAELQVLEGGELRLRQVKLRLIGEGCAAVESGIKNGELVIIPTAAVAHNICMDLFTRDKVTGQ